MNTNSCNNNEELNSFTAVCEPSKRPTREMSARLFIQRQHLQMPHSQDQNHPSTRNKNQQRMNRAMAGRVSRENERKAFEKLRQVLPTNVRNPNKRTSRLDILRQTCEYMKCLEKMLQDLDEVGVEIKE